MRVWDAGMVRFACNDVHDGDYGQVRRVLKLVRGVVVERVARGC